MNAPNAVADQPIAHAAGVRVRQFGSRHQDAANGRGIQAALGQEAHDAALLVAATGSIINAVVSGRRPQLRTSMAAYLPGVPLLFPTAMSTAAANSLSTQAIQSLSGFYGLIAFARSATLGYSVKREPGGTGGPISMETLAEAWQAAAMQAIGVLTTVGYLDNSSPLNEDGKDNAAALRLVEMLWGVTLGRSPCVRIDGNIIIPGWVERRTHLRREINAPATLMVNGKKQHVTIRDLSAGGVGLEGSPSVMPGDQVSVSLGSGVRFDGVAVWNRDGRVGIKLSTPMTTCASDE